MQGEIVHCPRCGAAMIRSDGESTLTKVKYRCTLDGSEYHKITKTGHLVEASAVMGAVTALGAAALAVWKWYATDGNDFNA